jgi:hypothetical protein
MKPKTPEELIRFAAESFFAKDYFVQDDKDGNLVILNHADMSKAFDPFDPLSDAGAYQLELIEAELVKLGFCITSYSSGVGKDFECEVKHYRKKIEIDLNCDYDKDQIRLTKLTAFCEAVEKYKELSK